MNRLHACITIKAYAGSVQLAFQICIACIIRAVCVHYTGFMRALYGLYACIIRAVCVHYTGSMRVLSQHMAQFSTIVFVLVRVCSHTCMRSHVYAVTCTHLADHTTSCLQYIHLADHTTSCLQYIHLADHTTSCLQYIHLANHKTSCLQYIHLADHTTSCLQYIHLADHTTSCLQYIHLADHTTSCLQYISQFTNIAIDLFTCFDINAFQKLVGVASNILTPALTEV